MLIPDSCRSGSQNINPESFHLGLSYSSCHSPLTKTPLVPIKAAALYYLGCTDSQAAEALSSHGDDQGIGFTHRASEGPGISAII